MPVPRWVTVVLPADYYEAVYRRLFREVVHPIVRAHRATSGRCVTDGFTEAEYCLPGIVAARACARDLNKRFRAILAEAKRDPAEDLLDRFGLALAQRNGGPILGPKATVMPLEYEEYGARVIVRPDSSFDPTYRARVCRGYTALFQRGLARTL